MISFQGAVERVWHIQDRQGLVFQVKFLNPFTSFARRRFDLTERCSGSEAGSYFRRIDCVYHSILDLRVIKKKKKI